MYGDGGGLCLQITGDGKVKVAKSWIFDTGSMGAPARQGSRWLAKWAWAL